MTRIGIDIVLVSEVEASMAAFGDRYLERVYTARELADSARAPARLAARFAAKEAALKALSVDDRGIDPRNIEVVRGASGAPTLELSGSARDLARERGVDRLAVSLSHEGGYATAVVLGEAAPPTKDTGIRAPRSRFTRRGPAARATRPEER